MKSSTYLLCTFLACALPLLAFAETPSSAPTIKQTTEHNAPQGPDFSPSKDLTGPTFPIEDLIGHPEPEENNKFLVEFLKMTATLGIVIVLILIVAWFLKRMVNAKLAQGNNDSSIIVVERRALSQKTMVYLLEVAGKGIVVAESPHGVTFLGNYPAAGLDTEEAPAATPASPFSQILNEKKTT
ncbi:MAG: flagellar biosynthetic protein FliO [Parachlamydiaceae bacterium]